MRILKYIFLLIVLGVVALFVFISTQDGKFTVSESKIIPLKKATLFEYVNEFKNWEDFYRLTIDSSSINFTYPEKTSSFGSSFTWKSGLNEGEIKTIYVKDNDSIAMKTKWNGNLADFNITFKDTIGGTKITWNSSGNQNFSDKLISLFYGGIEKQLQTNFRNSLTNLSASLTKEINTYSISIEQIVSVNKKYYLKRKSTSKFDAFNFKLQKEMPLVLRFANDNGVAFSGSPFTIFEEKNREKNLIKYALCLTVREKIYTTPESEFTIDSIMPHQALKVILKGDYSHTAEAWKKGMDYLNKNNFIENNIGKHREVYTKGRLEVNNPSQWITEIYIAVGEKIVEKPKIISQTEPISEELVE
jgi:effector-binding domain-containing protein